MGPVKITYRDQVYDVAYESTSLDFMKAHQISMKSPIGAVLNGRLARLNKRIRVDSSLEIVDITATQGQRIYESSVCMLFLSAFARLFPERQAFVQHSVPNGLYAEVKEGNISDEEVKAIEALMKKMVAEATPFERVTRDWDETMNHLHKSDRSDITKLYRYHIKEPVLKSYKVGSLEEFSYLPLVPDASFIKIFSLMRYQDGVAILLPNYKTWTIAPFQDHPKLFLALKEYHEWCRITKVRTVGQLNETIMNGNIKELMVVMEALHEKKIGRVADVITQRQHVPKIILIAGPSSSGKTTFSLRLGVHLRVNGYRPIAISLDNYFVERDQTPKDEEGKYDFECLEAIDVDLFIQHLKALLRGEEVEIPHFDFKTGSRKPGYKLKLAEDELMIIEGIHGINPKLTASIEEKFKFKIFVSALTQLNLHRHDRIPTSDTRLIRRIVRDSNFRGYSAGQTLNQWKSVRAGETKNIFPLQENADVFFNSALFHELAILKPKAEQELLRVENDHPMYAEAQRLLQFLSYFLPCDPIDVTKTSILREFIGGSVLKY